MTNNARPHPSQSALPTSPVPEASSAATPAGDAPALPAAAEALIRKYTSKNLTGSDAEVLLPQVRAAARKCAPQSEGEALALMSNTCRFLNGVLDAHPGLDRDLDVLLSEHWMNWWSNRCKSNGESTKTIAVQMPRLRRMRRVLDGLPARMRVPKTTKPLSDEPLQDAALRSFADLLIDRGVLATLAAAVCGGQVGSEAVGGMVVVTDTDIEFATVHGRCHLVPPSLHWLARKVVGEVVPDGGWDAVRKAAERDGITFNRVVATQTRTRAVFTSGAPVATLIADYGVSRRSITQIVPYLPQPTPEEYAAWLRGGEGERDCAQNEDAHGTAIPEMPGDPRSRS